MSSSTFRAFDHERGLFCNRTLNMRAIRAIGYDMDYTLVHYHIREWEEHAYTHVRDQLVQMGLDVGHLQFDADRIIRGLVIDTELGNVVKANRFGYVKRAFHGTKPLSFEELRSRYSRTMIDLSDRRWVFLNTLFSLSEAWMFSQLVDLHDEGALPNAQGYPGIYELTRKQVDWTHMAGKLKAEIMAAPEKFVALDEDAATALLDQKNAGKQLVLITNSEWTFTQAMMTYSYDRFLPSGTTWRDLFDLVIVNANKPTFFSGRQGMFEIASDDGLLRPSFGPIDPKKAYFGGNAVRVEEHLGLSGDEILYVGDHIFGDVNVTKQILRWRTALVVRELEHEIASAAASREDLRILGTGMAEKEAIERVHADLRLKLVRKRAGRAVDVDEAAVVAELARLRAEIQAVDDRLGPLAKRASEIGNPYWGPLMWAGNDKSHFARQVERYADVYTSRVSNFAHATPFVYLRSPRGALPHDEAPAAGGSQKRR